MASNNEGRLRRPKFSTVIALFALFAALGGTAFAAKQVINGKDIKKNTVTSKAVKNGTLKTKDLSSSAQSDLQGQKGAKGNTGAQGPEGPQGDPGADGVVTALTAEDDQALLPDGVPQDNVLSIDTLVGGTTYVINVKLVAAAGTANDIECTLSRSGAVVDEGRTSFTADNIDAMIALQAVAGGDGESAILGCEAINGGATAREIKITAIPVS